MEPEAEGALRERLRFEEWAGVNGLEYELFVRNFLPSVFLDTGWAPLRTTSGTAGALRSLQTLWRPVDGDGDTLLRIDVFESPSRLAAHEQLPRVLSQFQAPTLEQLDPQAVGDVAFAPSGGAATVFSRANLTFLMASVGREALPVAELAARLDDRLREPPASIPATRGGSRSAGKTAEPALHIVLLDDAAGGATADGGRSRSAPRTSRTVGARVPFRVVEDAGDTDAPMTLKLFSDGGEVQASADGLVLVPGAAGRCKLEVMGVTRNDAFVARGLDIDVE